MNFFLSFSLEVLELLRYDLLPVLAEHPEIAIGFGLPLFETKASL
jgi:hypothetical protein